MVKKIKSQNIISRLHERETDGTHKKGAYYANRSLYQNIFPNFTLTDIKKPPCFIRKFTPDGRYLIAFSSDQTSIEVYEYRGSAAASHLLRKLNQTREGDVRKDIFSLIFRRKHVINVATDGEHLNRECSLFTRDPNLMVVGSAGFIPEDQQPHYFDAYRSNDSVSLNPRLTLENYTLHLIDIQKGTVCDTKSFKTDKIFLSHHQGLCLYHRNLAILSVQHQSIHMICISVDPVSGLPKFNDLQPPIGRFCHSDDEMLLEAAVFRENQHSGKRPVIIRPFRETPISCLKHRLLVHLYQKAKFDCESSQSYEPLKEFYKNFETYKCLKMWKMQLLDDDHLFIKYTPEDVITRMTQDLNMTPFYFALYNFKTTKFIAIFEHNSHELLTLYEKYSDYFRNSTITTSGALSCSPSNNIYSRRAFQKFKQTVISSRSDGQNEGVKRLLSQLLPMSSQSFSPTPYLDLTLFSYDEKWISEVS